MGVVVLLACCAGLLGQIAEEMRPPIASDVFRHVEGHAKCAPPPADLTTSLAAD